MSWAEANDRPARERLEAVYREHRQGLYTLALSITRCSQSAEDAVHDAFVRLWRSATRPEGDPVAYVFAAVRNASRDALRRRRRAAELDESIFDADHPDPSAAAIQCEQATLLRKAVDRLPDAQREVVVLRLYAEMTFQQIADTLAEPLQTVASRYRRALQRIQREIA